MTRRILVGALGVFVSLLVYFLVTLPWRLRRELSAIEAAVLSGPLRSFERMFGSLEWSAWSVGVATIQVALVLVLLHSLIRWVSNGRVPWTVRPTALVFGQFVVLLIFTMAAGGIVHQVGWWMGSTEEKWERKTWSRSILDGLRMIDATIDRGPREILPASDLRAHIERNYPELREVCDFIVFGDEAAPARGVLFAFREKESRERSGYLIKTSPSTEVVSEFADLILRQGTPSQMEQIAAGDMVKLSAKLRELNVDPAPFVERWKDDAERGRLPR